MKTRKYSFVKKALMALAIFFALSTFVNAQFMNSGTNPLQTGEEVRTSSATPTSVDYDLSANHVGGEQYRWVVRGGSITAGGTVSPPSGDSLIIEWTSNADVITVEWDQDLSGSPIGSAPGEIIVQKRTAGGCASTIQVLPITMWNPATASIVDADYGICSGSAVGGNVTINLTGAPDGSSDGFEVTYDITATDITDIGGNPLTVSGSTESSDGATVSIALPDGLVNTTGTGADAYFTITLTSMHDDFAGNGTLIDDTFTITVYPTPETGDINSTPVGLARR